MNRTTLTTAVALATLLGATAVQAGSRDRDGDRFYDHARVLSVQPVIETVQIATPREECWSERVTVPRRPQHGSHGSATGIILGTIVGGAIGNNFGKGGGKDAMTIAGALLGASVGNDISRRGAYRHDDHGTTVTHIEQKCRTVDEIREETRTVAYDVQYRYQGHTYWSRMDHHPGKRVRVRVQVSLAQ